jgi:activating signal cointegrator 1
VDGAARMKAITIAQPHASLIALGALRVHSASWGTSYRGPLAIHAAAAFPELGRLEAQREPAFRLLSAARLHEQNVPRGAMVATARLVDCQRLVLQEGMKFLDHGDHLALVPRAAVPHLEAYHQLVDRTVGRWLWILEDVKRLEPPAPAKGGHGLWSLGPATIALCSPSGPHPTDLRGVL